MLVRAGMRGAGRRLAGFDPDRLGRVRDTTGAQSRRSAAELVLPGPVLGEMQGERARLAGEPSGQGEAASSEGLGGCHRFAQTEACRPAGQVMCHHPVSSPGQALHRQPGGVGGEASRWEMGEADPVLQSLPRT